VGKEAKGSFIDLMQCIRSHQKIDFQAINFSNKRASQISRNDANFSLAIKEFIPEHDQYVFSEEIVDYVNLNAFWIGDKSPIYSWEDLIHASVILLRGYSYGDGRHFIDNLEHDVKVITEVETHERGLKLLKKKRGDYFIGYKGPTEVAMKRLGWSIEQTNLKHSLLEQIPIYFVLSKTVDNAEVIMDKLELGLKVCRPSE
jgi:hypothetical protein